MGIPNDVHQYYWYRLHKVSYENSTLLTLANSAPRRHIVEIGPSMGFECASEGSVPWTSKEATILDAFMVQESGSIVLRDKREHLLLGVLSEFEANLWRESLQVHRSWPVAVLAEISQAKPNQLAECKCLTRRKRIWPLIDDTVEIELLQDLESFSNSVRNFIKLMARFGAFTEKLRDYLNSNASEQDVVNWDAIRVDIDSVDSGIFAALAEEGIEMYKTAKRMTTEIGEFDAIASLLLTILTGLEHSSLYLRATTASDLWGVLDWSNDPGTFHDTVNTFGEAVTHAIEAGWTTAYLGM